MSAPAKITPQLRSAYIALDSAIKVAVDEFAALRVNFETAISERKALVSND